MDFLVLIVWYLFVQRCSCEESFLLAFQNSKGLSPDEWAEFDGKVPHLKAFTSCHWEKLHFFNIKSHSIWNYCTIKNRTASIDCTQMWYRRGLVAAGRDITVGVGIGPNNIGYVNINPFKHRAWNHFCWSYDSSSGENRIYLNGKFYGTVQLENKIEVLGSREVYGSSFSVGQEPDAFRGKHDEHQAYRGNMSEINFWDYILTDEEVFNIGTCKKRGKGNVISWERKQFKFYNLTIDIIADVDKLCIPEEKILVFPEKSSLPSALALCKSHGG